MTPTDGEAQMPGDKPSVAGAALPPPITGRTAYDAAVEILQMLGRAAPWFIVVAAGAAILAIYPLWLRHRWRPDSQIGS